MSEMAWFRQLTGPRGTLPLVTTFRIIDFESLVRDFLAGKKQWNDVHNFVIESEWRGETDFTPGSDGAVKDLYLAFLADAEDDAQFLLSKSEIQDLLDRSQSSREQ
jgi:hypothetical protein